VIKFRKIFINVIKSIVAIVVMLIIVLFFYSAFFYTPKSITTNVNEETIVKEETENSSEEEILTEQKEKKDLKKIKIKLRDGMFATVGNKAITRSDVINEIKLILITNNMSYSDDKRESLRQMAATALIKRSIKEIELDKNENIKSNNDALNNELNRIAARINTNVSGLETILKDNDLDISLIEDQIKTELKWNSLIYYFYSNRVSVNQEEIDEQLDSIGNKKEYTEYLISEMVVKKVEDSLVNSEINRILKKIETDGFEAVAMSNSIAPTSIKGGDLGWLGENSLATQFKSIILDTPVGSISKAIILKDGILFFKVRNKRIKSEEINKEELKKKLLNAERTKILNMYSRSHYENIRRSITIKLFDE
jgi:parvulin-like peptidyl-prolyl isomerase